MIAILGLVALLAQQVSAPITVTARVQGTVTNSSNGEPVRKATVILHARDEDYGTNYADETDSNGYFSIDALEPGEYRITAEHPGFYLSSSGAQGVPPPNVKVEKEQHVSGLVIRLAPLGVITGRVLDADGDPVRGANVEALRYTYSSGKKQLTRTVEVRANENGDFRLFGLRAGTIYLKATDLQSRPGKPAGNIWSYYPGSFDESHAAPVQVRAGAQLAGFDIRLQTASLHSVRFQVPDGHPQEGAYNGILTDEQGRGANQAEIFTQTDVIFRYIVPGSYEAVISASNDGKQMYAIQHVEVANADVDGGTLTFLPPAELSGSVRVEGGVFNGYGKLRIDLPSPYPLPFRGQSTADVKADGSFVLKDAVPRVYEVAIERTPGVYLKSIRIGDKVLPDRRVDLSSKLEGLVIVLGADVGTMEGSVRNAKGDPVAHAQVTVIAHGQQSGRADLSRSAFSNDKGEFKIEDIAPGDYKVFAWEDVPEGAPQDPEFRKPFEKQATNVRMPSNGHERVSITAISAAAVKSDE